MFVCLLSFLRIRHLCSDRRISYIGNFSYLPPWKTAIPLLVFGWSVLFGWGLGWKTSATNSKQDILEIKDCNHGGCVCVVCVVCGGCWAQVAMDDVERRKLPAFQWHHTVLISAKWSSNRYIIGQTQSCKHCFGCSQCKMPLAQHKEQVNAFLFFYHMASLNFSSCFFYGEWWPKRKIWNVAVLIC